MLINVLRGHLAEYGIVTGLGAGGVTASLKALHEEHYRLPAHARSALYGIAAQTASAIAAAVPEASLFRSGRQFAASLGLTPRPQSSGGKERLGGITKQGDGYQKPPHLAFRLR